MELRKILEAIVCPRTWPCRTRCSPGTGYWWSRIEAPRFGQLHCAANHRDAERHLDVGIEKKHVLAYQRERGAAVAADGRHPAGDHLHIQPVAEAQTISGVPSVEFASATNTFVLDIFE